MTAILTTETSQKSGSLRQKELVKADEDPGEPFEIVEKVKEDLEKVNEILRTGSYTIEESQVQGAHALRQYKKEEEWVIVSEDEVQEAKVNALLEDEETPCIEVRIDRGEKAIEKSDMVEIVNYLTNDLNLYSAEVGIAHSIETRRKEQRKIPLEIKKPIRRKLKERQKEEELQGLSNQSGLTKFSSEESLDEDVILSRTSVSHDLSHVKDVSPTASSVPNVKDVSPVIEETPIGSIKEKVKALQKKVEEEKKGLKKLPYKSYLRDTVCEPPKQPKVVQITQPPISPSAKTEKLEETMSVRELMKAFQSGSDPSKERSGLFEYKTVKTSIQTHTYEESKSTGICLVQDNEVPSPGQTEVQLEYLEKDKVLRQSESDLSKLTDRTKLKSEYVSLYNENITEHKERVSSRSLSVDDKQGVNQSHRLSEPFVPVFDEEKAKEQFNAKVRVSISDQDVDPQISPDRKTSTDFSDVIKEELEDNDRYLQFKHLPETEGAQLNLDQVLISPFNIAFPSEYGTDGFLPALHLQSGTFDDSSDSLKHEGAADSPSGSLLEGTPQLSSEDSYKHEGLAETPGTSPESFSSSPKKSDELADEDLKTTASIDSKPSCTADERDPLPMHDFMHSDEYKGKLQERDHLEKVQKQTVIFENFSTPKFVCNEKTFTIEKYCDENTEKQQANMEYADTVKSPQGLELNLLTQDEEVSSPLADESIAISHKDSLEASPVLEDNSSHKTPDSLEPSPTKESPCHDSLESSPVEPKIKSGILIGSVALHTGFKSDLTTEILSLRSRILRDPDASAEDDSIEQTSLVESSGKSPLSPDTPSSEEISYEITPKQQDLQAFSMLPKPGTIQEVSEEPEDDSESEPKKRFTPEEEMFKMVTKIKMFDELEQEAKQKREFKKESRHEEFAIATDPNNLNENYLHDDDMKLVQDEDLQIVVMSVESRKSSSSSESEPELTQLKKGADSGLLMDPVIRVQPPSPLPPSFDSSSSPEETAFQPITHAEESCKREECQLRYDDAKGIEHEDISKQGDSKETAHGVFSKHGDAKETEYEDFSKHCYSKDREYEEFIKQDESKATKLTEHEDFSKHCYSKDREYEEFIKQDESKATKLTEHEDFSKHYDSKDREYEDFSKQGDSKEMNLTEHEDFSKHYDSKDREYEDFSKQGDSKEEKFEHFSEYGDPKEKTHKAFSQPSDCKEIEHEDFSMHGDCKEVEYDDFSTHYDDKETELEQKHDETEHAPFSIQRSLSDEFMNTHVDSELVESDELQMKDKVETEPVSPNGPVAQTVDVHLHDDEEGQKIKMDSVESKYQHNVSIEEEWDLEYIPSPDFTVNKFISPSEDIIQAFDTTQCLEQTSDNDNISAVQNDDSPVKSPQKGDLIETEKTFDISTIINQNDYCLIPSSTHVQKEETTLSIDELAVENRECVPEVTSPYENVPLEQFFTSQDIVPETEEKQNVFTTLSDVDSSLTTEFISENTGKYSAEQEDAFQSESKRTSWHSSTSSGTDECSIKEAFLNNATENQCNKVIITKSEADSDSWSSIREDDEAFEARVKEEEQKIFGLMVDKQSQGTTPDTTPARTPTEDGTPTSEQNPFLFQEGKLFEMTRSGAIDMTKRNYSDESFHFFQIGQQCGEDVFPEEIKEESGEEESPNPESLPYPFDIEETDIMTNDLEDIMENVCDAKVNEEDLDFATVDDSDTEVSKTEQKSRIPIKMGISASAKSSKKVDTEIPVAECPLQGSNSHDAMLSSPEHVNMQLEFRPYEKLEFLEREESPDSSPEEKSVIEIPTAVMEYSSSSGAKSKIPVRSGSSLSEEHSQTLHLNTESSVTIDDLNLVEDQKPKSKIPVKASLPKSEQHFTLKESSDHKISETSSKLPVKQDIRSKSESDTHSPSDAKVKRTVKARSCTDTYCETTEISSQISEEETSELTKSKLPSSRLPVKEKSVSASLTTTSTATTDQEYFFEMYKNSIDFFEEISDEASKLVDRLTQAEKEQEPVSDDESSAFEISVIENVPAVEAQPSVSEDIFDTRPIWDKSIETQIERIPDDHSHDSIQGNRSLTKLHYVILDQ
ncbi:ankyrin-2-like [Rhinophrynus dorsalis]